MDALSNSNVQEKQVKMCFHCGCEEATTKEYFSSCVDCFWDHEGEFRKWRGAFNYYHEHEGKTEEEADILAKKEVEPWFLRFMEMKEYIYSLISKGMTEEDAKMIACNQGNCLSCKKEINYCDDFCTSCGEYYEGEKEQVRQVEMCFHCGVQEATLSDYNGSCADCYWDLYEEMKKYYRDVEYYQKYEEKTQEEAEELAKQEIPSWILKFIYYREKYYSLIDEGKTEEEANELSLEFFRKLKEE